MLGTRPLKQTVKQWQSLFLFPLFINGGLGDSVSVSGRNKCSLSSFTFVPARDVFGVAQRKQCCLLWETETSWVSLPVSPSPGRRSLALLINVVLSAQILYLSLPERRLLVQYSNNLLSLSLSLLAGNTKQLNRVRQKQSHAQNTQTLVVFKSSAEIHRVQEVWTHTVNRAVFFYPTLRQLKHT